MKKISVGIIIPVYNVERYLEECLESVLNQKEPFDEVIIVDDGSTDKSNAILKEYCAKYPEWILIEQRNQGLSIARNQGINASKSDYIAFLDADDYLRDDTVSKIKEKITNQDVVFFAASLNDEIGLLEKNPYTRKAELCHQLMSGLEFFLKSCIDNHIVPSCLAVYRNTFLKDRNIYFPAGLYYEDNYFYIQVITQAKLVECMEDQLYIRRLRENSIVTGEQNYKKCESMIQVHLLIVKYLVENNYWDGGENTFSHYMMNILFSVNYFFENKAKIKEKNQLLIRFLNEYLECLISRNRDYSFSCVIGLAKANGILCKLQNIQECKYNSCIRELLENNVKEKLKKVYFFSEDKKIGIYGKGKHTQELLALYKKFYGSIQCKIFYIVTEILEKADDETVTYKNIPSDTDYIVVSSLIFQKEMLSNLLEVMYPIEKIVLLYDEDNFFDICGVTELLN